MANQSLKSISGETLYITAVIMAVFFMTDRFTYSIVALLSSFLLYLLVKAKGKIRYPGIINVLASYGLLIFLQMLVQPSTYFSFEIALKELARLCIYTLVILVAANTQIREERFLKLWSFIFLFSLCIAVFQFMQIGWVSKILVSVYGDSIFWGLSSYSSLDSFRSGSVFINPNNYAKFILAFLGIFLAIDSRRTTSMTYAMLFSLAIVVSLLLAGSRTGMLIAAMMLASFCLRRIMTRKGKIRVGNLLIFILLLLIGTVGITIYVSIWSSDFAGFRALRIAAGLQNSMAYKVSTFCSMIGQFTATNLLMGMGPFETDVRYLTKIDFDLGYLVTFYGIAGCILYAWMLHDVCQYRKHMPSRYSYLNKLLILVFILFGLTGGMFFNLRSFTMLATIFYANIVGGYFETIRPSFPNETRP